MATFILKIVLLLKDYKMSTVVIDKIVIKASFSIKLKTCMFLLSLFLLSLVVSTDLNAQQMNVIETQAYLKKAIKKAYGASVRIWGFDVERNERTSAQFSGVVVSEKGVVLTAAHTISPGRTYKIFFPDGREAIAKALGRIDLEAAPGTPDAGMLQILDKGAFPFVEMGFSASLKEKEACISISYPERINLLLPTLRYGKVAEVKNEYGFIRSTCKMEPGDSGGALFDQLGRLIGIHSAIDVSEEMNFEIPIDVYRKYWTALQEQINYVKYPSQEDSFNQGAMESSPKIGNLDLPIEKFATKLIKKKHDAYLLTSKLEGVDSEAIGTVINYIKNEKVKEQFVLSKNSIVGDLPCLWADGVKISLEVVKRDVQTDLTLLKTSKKLKGGIDIISSQVNEVQLGAIVIATLPDGKYKKGMIGNELIALEKSSSIPYFGASVLFKSKPATTTVVKTGSPAANAGLQTGDFIISMNGVAIRQASEVAPELAKYWAGQEITVNWLRGEQTFSKSIKLMNKPFMASKHPVDRFIGGSSERRDGFKQVFTHDAVLLPSQCGAPIFGIDGQFLGINIARFSRAVSLGIPCSVILDFLKEIPSQR